MNTSTVTQKGQATIPLAIRKKMALKAGDTVLFDYQGKEVTIKKVTSLDISYLKSLEKTVASEWSSQADNKAYDQL
jgi:AbrB family looped-hinge helix DNA binding protein